MKHITVINQFREELSSLSREVETSVAMGHFDINKICEDLFCGIFKELYELENLRNLNADERRNFPGIDLADDEARVAIQVTSDKSLDKVKDGLTKVIKYGLYKQYDRVIFYILTRKQRRYSLQGLDTVCDGKIAFDPNSDILDFTDLATRASNVSPKRLKRVAEILGEYTRGCGVGLADEDFDPPAMPAERLSANLVEVYFPKTLYIGEILSDVFDGKKVQNQRKELGEHVRKLERSVPSDYEVSSGKLITFHNLGESNNPFSFLVDEGTVEPFAPADYYGIDADHERIFKSLLRFSLQQKLYRQRVVWKHKQGLFIFLPIRDSDDIRTEPWIGQKKSRRKVFERKYNKKDLTKVLSTKHFAFSASFITIGGDWYMAITPNWFFSYGERYQESHYGDKLLSGLKRMEKNRSVFDQFRFLCSWLTDLDSEDLFSNSADSSPQLTFGGILGFEGAPHLNEDLWEPLVVVDEDSMEQGALELR